MTRDPAFPTATKLLIGVAALLGVTAAIIGANAYANQGPPKAWAVVAGITTLVMITAGSAAGIYVKAQHQNPAPQAVPITRRAILGMLTSALSLLAGIGILLTMDSMWRHVLVLPLVAIGTLVLYRTTRT